MPQTIIRTFLAIDLPNLQKSEILQIIEKFKKSTQSEIKWVSRENLHITLKFLGEFNSSHVRGLEDCLKNSLQDIGPFDLVIDSLGAFPNFNKPKVIWLGLGSSEILKKIFRQIENCAFELGYEKDDRPFSPHLTLGRVRRNASYSDIREIGRILSNTKIKYHSEFTVDKVIFFESRLSRESPEYTQLFDIDLPH